MDRWRVARSRGNAFAAGWFDPFLQKAGFSKGRILAVNQTRACSSIIGLCMLVWLSQMASSPQYGDAARVLFFEDGVIGSRPGGFTFRGPGRTARRDATRTMG